MSQYESNLSMFTPAYPQADGLRRFAGLIGAEVAGLLATVFAWRERARSRRHLAGLNDHMLRDIGIDRASASAEADKGFWER
jgi:uncharacterized protein YjiS (DUF1127 family)